MLSRNGICLTRKTPPWFMKRKSNMTLVAIYYVPTVLAMEIASAALCAETGYQAH